MNWTEGNLARHSRGRKGKEVLLRQKEHFAKARSSLLNANVKISPPSISFFAHPAHSSSPTRHGFSKLIPPVSSSARKRARENGPLQTSHYFKDATVELPSPASFQKRQGDEGDLAQKRQKLLVQGDWVGTNVQKPIQMEFTKTRASAGNPWGGSRSRHHLSKQRLRHLLGIKATDGHNRMPKPVTRSLTPITRSQLKVRVGSRERALGDGNSDSSTGSTTYRDIESSSHARIHGPKHYEEQKGHTSHRNGLGRGSNVFRTSGDPGQSVTQIISPPLHQPVPYRPCFPQLPCAQSSDSDNSASNKAQVGLHRSDILSSQMEENDAWREFIIATGRDQATSDFLPSGSPGSVVQREISPGVSQLGQSRPIERSEEEQEPLNPLRWGVHDTSPIDQEAPAPILANHVQSARPVQSNQLRHCPSLESSKGEDLTSCAIEPSPTSLQPDASYTGRSSEPAEDTMNDKAPGLSEDLDEVSLLVLPSPSSYSSEDILGNLDILPETEGRQVGNGGIESTTQQHVQPQYEESAQPSCGYDQQFNAKKEDPSKPRIIEKESDIWREFVMGESEDNLEQAFEQARKETLRNLRPSDTSESVDEEDTIEHVHHCSGLAELSVIPGTSFGVEVRDFVGQHGQSPTTISTVASLSRGATVGDSSPDPLSEPIPAYSDTTVHSDQATAGSSSIPLDGLSDLVNEFSHRSEMWSLATQEMDNASLIAHPPSTHEYNDADNTFRFARPKPFKGKKTSHMDEQRQLALSVHQIRGKPQTRRRQRRSGDERLSIRKLPNFSSDPIEEVEEDISAKRAHKPSLFGSLDTEE